MYNLASLALGLAAWVLAAAALFRKSPWLPYGSFTCCAAALTTQFLEIRRRCLLGDFSAIDDTIEGILFAALSLTIVTLLLNAVALMRKRHCN